MLRELLTTSWSGAAPATWNGTWPPSAPSPPGSASAGDGLRPTRRPGCSGAKRSTTVPAASTRLRCSSCSTCPAPGYGSATLWRMLYETAARAEEILTLDIGDLDLDNKRPGSAPRAARSSTCSGRPVPPGLLPRLIAGRGGGPLFLADRRSAPARTPATADICPVTGRGRAVLPARGVPVQAGQPARDRFRPTRLVPAPAPPLRPDPPRRQRPHRRRATGQEPPHLPAHPRPLRQPRPRAWPPASRAETDPAARRRN